MSTACVVSDPAVPESGTPPTLEAPRAVERGWEAPLPVPIEVGGPVSPHAPLPVDLPGPFEDECRRRRFIATDVPRAIPDNDPDGIVSTLYAPVDGVADGLAVSFKILHPYPGDLEVTLSAPDGTSHLLHRRIEGNGGSRDNLVVLELPVSAFHDAPITGEWSLHVADLARLDAGVLWGWGVSIVRCPP